MLLTIVLSLLVNIVCLIFLLAAGFFFSYPKYLDKLFRNKLKM